eukprot:TRINITY_DN1159_c0_g1_i4.p1 TRINITY_DN1159_c0_g1~~TRINITY_DN1159_c0_g1_i4.p1  ORF type:complete len:159 (-),score=31.21 TRINITY_DN1159_c0_g1_i4:86-562(-)
MAEYSNCLFFFSQMNERLQTKKKQDVEESKQEKRTQLVKLNKYTIPTTTTDDSQLHRTIESKACQSPRAHRTDIYENKSTTASSVYKEEINRDREILKVLINEFEQTIAESKIGGLTYQPMARLESLDQKVKTDLNNVDQKNKLLLSMATSVQRRFEG